MQKKLSDFNLGESGRILEVQNLSLKMALLAHGVTPGEVFRLTESAPMGGPLAIQVNGTKIAVRRQHAAQIQAELVE